MSIDMKTARPYLLLISYLLLLALIFFFVRLQSGGGGTGQYGTGQGAGGNASGRGAFEGTVVSDSSAAGDTASTVKAPSEPVIVDWSASGSNTAPVTSPGARGSEGKRSFYGVEVKDTEQILFLVDISGSMDLKTPEKTTRLEVLKRELLNVITSSRQASSGFGAKRSGSNCHITAFSEGVVEYRTGMSAGSENERNMREFVQGLGSGGSTNMLLAWEHVLPQIKEGKIDTVYFLTDGEPSDCSPEQLEKFLKTNLPARLKVHCFSIGTDAAWLKNIAAQHRGIYMAKY